MRGALGCLFVVGVIGTFSVTTSRTLRAQTPEPLQVDRASGAEDCPDAPSLAERVATIRGRADLASGGGYGVSFARTDELYRATIRSGPNGESQRVLEGRGPTCAALAQATAVTLALLFDSQADAPAPEPAPKPEPAPPNSSVASIPELEEPLPHEPPAEPARVDATLSLGVAGALGVLRPVAPALSAELGLQVARFRAGLGVLWIPTQSLELEPGRIDESLLAGTARSCLALTRAQGLALSLCSGLFVGVVDARSDGFTRNARRVRTWLSVPLELSLARLSGPVGWELSAAALGSLVHHDFEVDGLGTPYHAPRVGGLITLRGAFLLPL